MIGDINTHFGVQYGSTKMGPSERVQIFNNLCNKLSLKHINPNGNTPNHYFINNTINNNYLWKFEYNIYTKLSDHIFMSTNIELYNNFSTNDHNSNSYKYYLTPLNNKLIRSQILWYYNENNYLLKPILNKFNNIDEKSNTNIYLLIELAFDAFNSLIKSICDENLGSYNVYTIKNKLDNNFNLDNNLNLEDVMIIINNNNLHHTFN